MTILFTKKLNSGHYRRMDKIFGTVKKWSLVILDRLLLYAVKMLPSITWVDSWSFNRGGC